MNSLRFDLHAAGILMPGIGSLEALLQVSSGRAPYMHAPLQVPAAALLPAHERRRASQVVRLVLACVAQVQEASAFAVDRLRSVFATDEGTGEVCQQMMEALATTRQVSPLVFPNSVHNAPSGYFSIALRNQQPATVVSLGLESFAAGLLCAVTDAATSRQPVLLVAYDPAMTSPFDEVLAVTEPVATAWVIGASLAPAAVLATFEMSLAPAGSRQATPLPPWLAGSFGGHSSAHAVGALGMLAGSADAACDLAFGGQLLSLRRVGGAAP